MSERFVLVHGAWHGAWCWAAVMAQLEALGDRAYAVDLPGHGASKIDRATVTRQLYVDSVADFIERNDLTDVVLAGHSLGGITIPGVAAKIPRRIKRVVWMTAMVINDGEAPAGSLPPIPNSEQAFAAAAARPDRSMPIELIADVFRANFMQDASRDMQDFILAALTPEPLGPFGEPVPMREFFATAIPQSYVICEDDISPNGARGNWHPTFSSRLQNPTTRTIKSGHEVMFTKPVECARALHELVRS